MSKKILIMYYSHSGNTAKIARMIQNKTGGTLFEIQPRKTYPSNYNACVEQAGKEIKSGFLPELVKSTVENITDYDLIFIGSPNWWSTIAPPVSSFLSVNDVSGKTLAPFITHGGGGVNNTVTDLKKMCPNSMITEAFVIGGSGFGADEKIETWLNGIDLQ